MHLKYELKKFAQILHYQMFIIEIIWGANSYII